MSTIGEIGENLVAQYLETSGWQILHHRWHCRWGEIDLIAQNPVSHLITFVEVKTRRFSRNWDSDGRYAITPRKQTKLWQTAELFLSKYPHLANLPCRFDVALISYQKIKPSSLKNINNLDNQTIKKGDKILYQGYLFTLNDYIESAWEEI